MPDLYLDISVWKRIDENCAVCYRCLKLLGGEKYIVQTKNFHWNGPSNLALSEQLFIDHFRGAPPEERTLWSDTLEGAVARFDSFDDAFCI